MALAFAVGACARSSATQTHFAVHSADIEDNVLAARLDWQPNPTLLDALDHGIALTFRIRLDAQAPAWNGMTHSVARVSWQRELRYFPLTRQYQLRDPAGSAWETRTYAARASLIAAIADLRLPLPSGFPPVQTTAYVLRVDLARDNLPGALRLPALFDVDWHLSTGTFAWPFTASAR